MSGSADTFQSIVSDVAIGRETSGLGARELANGQATPNVPRYHAMPKLAPAAINVLEPLKESRPSQAKRVASGARALVT